MENLRRFFLAVGCRCCYITEFSSNENLEQEDNNRLDVTSSQNPKMVLEKNSKVMNLVVVESEKIQMARIYTIDTLGLKNSERTTTGDGCVYAGSLYCHEQNVINDILLPQSEKGVGKRHFMIKYKESSGSFYLKDLGDGMGTFIRLNKPLPIQNNYIISFGDSHMIACIENNTPPRLMLKFIDGPKVDQKFKFVPSDCPIMIGRMADCRIRFDDNSLSRYHCMITFNGWWYIQDGDGKKISTNGTWLFVDEFFEIFHGMLFKAGETLFRADIRSV